jgi:signal recognition particle subunit SRP54
VYRPAAIEQLKQLATENKIDFFSNDSNNPIEIAGNAELFALKNNNDVIIYDTAGRLQTDKKLMNELTNMQNKIHPHEIFFIADAFAGQNIYDVAKEFNNNINLTGLIITKLDSEARGGASLSLAYLLEIPIKFSGTGEKIGSLEVFHPERVANRILGLGDMVTLAEKIEENVDQQTIKKTFARMLSGKMDLEDLLVQMQQLTKVGSFDSILKMMPNAQKLDENQILEVEEKIRK